MNTIDTTKLITDYNNFKAKKGTFNLKDYYRVKSFIPHSLAVFASVPLIRNSEGLISMVETMRSVINSKSTFTNLTGEQVSQLVMFIGEVNRSKICSSNEHTFKAFTPLFMYAHKLYNDVEYIEWDKNDKAINYALGRMLFNCYEYAKLNEKPEFTLEQVKSLREELMTYKSGKKEGQTEKITSNKMSKWNEVPAPIMQMELQTWIANAELRNTKAMILDMWNWGNIPNAYDITIH